MNTQQNSNGQDCPSPSSEKDKDLSDQKAVKKPLKRGKKNPIIPSWLSWGLLMLVTSFALTVAFSFVTEISISDGPAYVCVIVMLVILVINISCDLLANAILTSKIETFHAMAARKIKGSKRAVTFCRNATRLGSIFADVIGDICGIVSGSAGTVLIGYVALALPNWEYLLVSILITAVIGGLTVGGKALAKPFAIKYNKQIVFGFAKFTTFFKKEK